MMQNYDAIAQAEGDINVAILRLLEKYPLHARILEQARVRVRPEIGTMAVSVAGDDLMLYHNPDFVLSRQPDELRGVVLHEVHHVLFGHVTADPADFPDEWARTVAEEVSCNEFVKEPLPSGAVTLEMFPELPPMESTQQRYDRLKKVRNGPPISSPGAGAATPEASHEEQRDVKGEEDNESDTQPEKENHKNKGTAGEVDADGAGPGEGGEQTGQRTQPHANQQNPAAKPDTLKTIDAHWVWAEARQDSQRSKDVIRDAIQQAALEVGPDQIPEALKDVCPDLDIMDFGSTPSRAERVMGKDKTGCLDWRRQLRRYAGEVAEVRPVFNRPPRRFPKLAGILPGRRRQHAKPKIMAVIDTSGSITDDLLQIIDGELARLAKGYTVKVVECDAMIHAVYDYKPIKKVHGGGGTDFYPPLEKDFLRQHRPDLLLYFTDGYGPAPDKPPKVSVIWCLTPNGIRPAPWGKVIQMGKSPSRD